MDENQTWAQGLSDGQIANGLRNTSEFIKGNNVLRMQAILDEAARRIETGPKRVNLMDADTAEPIGPATPDQIEASNQAAAHNGTGIILVSADGTPVADGTWEADQPGVRRVYTEPAEFTFTEQLNSHFLCTHTRDGKQCRVRHSHGVWESASAEGELNAETGVYEWNWTASPVAGASESREGAAYAYFHYAHTPSGEFHEQQETQE